jgi:DNA-directed RNA polymerases I and III subunit RPAC2
MSVNEVKYVKAPFQFQVLGTGPPGSRTFAIGDEDHTLGNTLRHVLMQNAKVDFAGYAVPHPSEPVVNIRVQTAKGGSNSISAIEALKEGCATLHQQCAFVLEQLEEVMPEAKEDRIELEERLAKEDAEAAALDELEDDYMDDDQE